MSNPSYDALLMAQFLIADPALTEALTTLEAMMLEESSVDRLLMLHECCASPHELETLLERIKDVQTRLVDALIEWPYDFDKAPQNRAKTGQNAQPKMQH